jgi:hypothetical protein
VLGRLPALHLGRQRHALQLRVGRHGFERPDRDADVQPEHGETEQPRRLHLDAHELDGLVGRHEPVDAPSEVDVATERCRLQLEVVAEPAELEHVLVGQRGVVTPRLVSDHLDAGPEAATRRPLEKLRQRVPARQPLVREGESRGAEPHSPNPEVRIQVRIRTLYTSPACPSRTRARAFARSTRA